MLPEHRSVRVWANWLDQPSSAGTREEHCHFPRSRRVALPRCKPRTEQHAPIETSPAPPPASSIHRRLSILLPMDRTSLAVQTRGKGSLACRPIALVGDGPVSARKTAREQSARFVGGSADHLSIDSVFHVRTYLRSCPTAAVVGRSHGSSPPRTRADRRLKWHAAPRRPAITAHRRLHICPCTPHLPRQNPGCRSPVRSSIDRPDELAHARP